MRSYNRDFADKQHAGRTRARSRDTHAYDHIRVGLCVYVCICTYIYIHIHIRMYACNCVYAYMYTRLCVCVHQEYHDKHGHQLPVLRDLKGSFYVRDERDGILQLGIQTSNKPYGIPQKRRI